MAQEIPGDADRGAARTSRVRLVARCLFLLPFFAAGLFFFAVGVRDWLGGKTREGLAACDFATVFLLLSVAMLAWFWRQHRREREDAQLRARHAAEPWYWRPDWARGRIESGSAAAVRLAWALAILFNVTSVLILSAFPREWARGNHAIAFGLLFPLAGLWLLISAVRTTIAWRKYGRSAFELSAVPGALGGTLGGAVEIPVKVRPETGFKLRLVCIRRTVSGSGKNRTVREDVLWEDTKTVVKDLCEHDPTRTAIPVHFHPPIDQPPSTEGNPAVIWRLEVSAAVPGVDYTASFDVPVFPPRARPPGAVPEADPTAAFQPAGGAFTPPTRSRILVRDAERGGIEIVFPPARNVGIILGLLVFLVIWNSFLWLMVVKQVPLLFLLVWGFADGLLVLFLAKLLFHSVRIRADRDGVTVRHGFILPWFTRRVAAPDLVSVRVKQGLQSGTKVFYDLRLVTRTGKEYAAGGGIPDKPHAEWLAAQLRAALGLAE